MKKYLRSLIWSLPICVSSLCQAQTITVRIVNARNGHSLPKQKVTVALYYKGGESTPAKYDPQLHLETDADGVAQFTLPQPPPAHLWIGAGLPSEYWHCDCATAALANTQDLIEKGIGGRGDSTSSKIPSAKPGQVIFVARPYNLFERLVYPLMKE
jgi:hypothetical protein